MVMRKTVLLLASVVSGMLLVCGMVLVAPEKPARAAFPGENGKIAFVGVQDNSYQIFAVNSDGSGVTNLTNLSGMTHTDPAWSPDGTKIAFRRDQPDADIFAANADGTGATNLTNQPGVDGEPAWSPDGRKIAFVTDRDADKVNWDSNYEIYLINADGSNPTRLTSRPSADVDPAWAPDGTKIAFAGYQDGDYSIFTVKPDGTGLTRLTSGTGDYEPAWSPDGTKITFKSQRDGNSEIYVMNADGTEQKNLTNNPATQDANPAWSPDGTKIAFDTTYGDIYTMNADGSGQASFAGTSGRVFDPDWQPLPDTVASKVTRVNPAENAKGIAPGANVNAIFSEGMRVDSINVNTIELFKKGSTTKVAAAVSYDVATNKARLDPTSSLTRGAPTRRL